MTDSSTRAWIFNKVQGSFVDGYGVRTTIFLKGCPLKCKWCCNPEGQYFRPELKIAYNKCDGCGQCLSACAWDALKLEDGKISVDRTKCTACGSCSDVCWKDVLEPFGRYYTVDEMFEFLKKDKSFYDSSGGGVTIGGGEATWFPDFVLPLIEKCHSVGIRVAIDTCGYVSDPAGIQVMKNADLLLYDIKGLNEEKHIENTGVSNKVIWENLRMLGDMGKPIIIRMPIIPGYSDDMDELEEIADKLKKIHSIERVDILPFHPLGKNKYYLLNMEYVMPEGLDLGQERQEQIKSLFESRGFNTQIGG